MRLWCALLLIACGSDDMLKASQFASSANTPPLVGPDVSAVYFAAWNNLYNYPDTWSFYSNFNNRFSTLYSVDGWEKGPGINTVAILESENAAANDAGISAWAFDFYLPSSIVEPADPDQKHEYLQAGLEAYLATSNKSLMKFWVTGIVDYRFGLTYPTTDPFKYFDAFATYIANLMTDPQWLTIDGLKVLGIFGGSGPQLDVTRYAQLTAPMGGPSAVYLIQMDGNTSKASELGAKALFKYGIGLLPLNQGHKPYSLSSNADIANWTPSSGRQQIVQFTPTNDSRALHTTVDSTTWVDLPTQNQFYSLVNAALLTGGSKAAITIWNELAEESICLSPTAEENGRLLQAVKWARKPQSKPTTFTYKVNFNNADTSIVQVNGAGTYVGPIPTGVNGCHERDQLILSTTGHYRQLTLERMTACNVWVEKGPDCGILEVYKDGVLDQTIDCYASVQSISVNVATVTFSGAPATHTVKVVVKGTKNILSSSVQIKGDFFEPTYVP